MARSRRTSALLQQNPVVEQEPVNAIAKNIDIDVNNENTTSNILMALPSQLPLIESAEGLFKHIESGADNGPVIDAWISQYTDSPLYILPLLNTILLAANVSPGIPQNYFKRKSVQASFVIGEIVDRIGTSKTDPEYPVSESKGKKMFRKHYCMFFREWAKKAVVGVKDLEGLKVNVLSWIMSMSGCSFRPIRMASTFAGFATLEGLAEQSAVLSRQLERLNKMKKRKDSEGATSKIASAEDLISYLFEGIFVQRYRDVDVSIRGDSLRCLSECISLYPEVFLDNAYLRYLGWSLSDREEKCRISALQYLKAMYKSANQRSALPAFTDRFKSRLLEMASRDVEQRVRQRACEVVEVASNAGLLIAEDCVELVKELVSSKSQDLAYMSTTVQRVIFGQLVCELSLEQTVAALQQFLQSDIYSSLKLLAPCFSVKFPDTIGVIDSEYLLYLAGIYKHVLPEHVILEREYAEDAHKLAFFTYISNSNPPLSPGLLEKLMNEFVELKDNEECAGMGIKILGQWRVSQEFTVQVEQWMETAVSSCWESVRKFLDNFQKKPNYENTPFMALSYLTSLRACTSIDVGLIINGMERLEGLSLLSRSRSGASFKAVWVYQRLLIILYNHMLWTLKAREDPQRIVEALKNMTILSKPIMSGKDQLKMVSAAILTDLAILLKSPDTVSQVLEYIWGGDQVPQEQAEKMAAMLGRLYVAGLIPADRVVPWLVRWRDVSKVVSEIGRVALERSKTLPASSIVALLQSCLVVLKTDEGSAQGAVKLLTAHYKPVLSGAKYSECIPSFHELLVSEVGDLGAPIAQWLYEPSQDIVKGFSCPPTMKLYRRVLEKYRTARGGNPVNSESLQSENLTSQYTSEADPEDSNQQDGDEEYEHRDLDSQIQLTSPGPDPFDRHSPSLPNSPLTNKMIRLE